MALWLYVSPLYASYLRIWTHFIYHGSTIHSVKIFKQINVRNPSFISCNSFKWPRSFITALTDRHQENFPATFSWGEESSSLGATFPGSKQRSERKGWMFQLWPPEDQQGNFDSGAWLKAKWLKSWFGNLNSFSFTQSAIWFFQILSLNISSWTTLAYWRETTLYMSTLLPVTFPFSSNQLAPA